MIDNDERSLNAADERHPEETKEGSSTPAIVVEPLPAQIAEEPLDEVVSHINGILNRSGMEVTLEVGRFVLHRFFEGSPAVLADRGRRYPSYRALAGRQDLQVSHTWLWRAVRIYIQLPKLPEEAATRLSPTHHGLLLPIRDRATKRQLAERAIEEQMSSRDLADAVNEALWLERPLRSGRKRSGPRPVPTFLKTVRKLGKLVEDDASWCHLNQIGRLSPDDAVAFRQTIGLIEAKCEELRAALRSACSPTVE
jgi:hypothetical protein